MLSRSKSRKAKPVAPQTNVVGEADRLVIHYTNPKAGAGENINAANPEDLRKQVIGKYLKPITNPDKDKDLLRQLMEEGFVSSVYEVADQEE